MSSPDIAGRRARPISPHLTVYRFIPTMAMSIVHRATGIALYFGMALVAWWLLAAATSEAWFDIATAVIGSWFGIAVLAGASWALIHHLLGGVRHLVWDTGAALEKPVTTALAHATWIGSLALTALLWLGIVLTHR